jgi:DeoR/GlpR family transcriptional regulator of sugar metabolism
MTVESISNIERQQRILQFLNQQERISVIEICEMFSISEATARRDLEVLTEQNFIRRVHGGAISLKQAPPESPIVQRETKQAEEKRRIGKAAANLIQNGQSIFLGSGSTVLEVARELRNYKDLTIITNSLPVLNTLSRLKDITVIALGGMLRESELSFIGHITEQALGEIRVDKVIIGIHAIHLDHGLTNDYLPETMTDRAILKAGNEVVVVADHTKINIVSTAFLAPVNSINKLITDQDTPIDFIASLENLGIEVVVAS